MELIIGLIIGILIGAVLFRSRPIGDIRIDHSDPSGEPYLFLELDTDVRTVASKRYATFKVRVEDFIPHK